MNFKDYLNHQSPIARASAHKLSYLMDEFADTAEQNNMVGIFTSYGAGGVGGSVWQLTADFSDITIDPETGKLLLEPSEPINVNNARERCEEQIRMILSLKNMLEEHVNQLDTIANDLTQFFGRHGLVIVIEKGPDFTV